MTFKNAMKFALVLLIFLVVHSTRRNKTNPDDLQVKPQKTISLKDEKFCFENLSTCQCNEPRARHIDDSEKWLYATNSNQERVRKAVGKLNTNEIESYDIVFYGDSITEDWAGARFGKPDERHTETLQVFNNFFSLSQGGSYEGLAFGIAGDTGPNLIWRLQNGEMPPSLRSKVWWILIGTNDLSRKQCSVQDVVGTVEDVVMEVLKRALPEETIVVNGLLPRFDDENYNREDGQFWEEIQEVNKAIQQLCEEKKKKGFDVVYFEENSLFFKEVNDKTVLNEGLMPDKLHPNAAGHKLWATEIVSTLDSIFIP